MVKFNGGIIGKNWLHLRDGTGSAADGSNDILVTSNDVARVGDIVTVKGTVRTDKDFGAGYAYEVLIEEATVQPWSGLPTSLPEPVAENTEQQEGHAERCGSGRQTPDGLGLGEYGSGRVVARIQHRHHVPQPMFRRGAAGAGSEADGHGVRPLNSMTGEKKWPRPGFGSTVSVAEALSK